MNISREFLLEAVGLSLMVALLLVGVKMFQRTSDFIAAIDREQEQSIAEMKEYELVRYDEMIIDGITAIGYIKMVVGEYQIPVYVETSENSFLITDKKEYAGIRNLTSPYYMDTLALYQCTVIRSENESVERVEIKVQKERKENE